MTTRSLDISLPLRTPRDSDLVARGTLAHHLPAGSENRVLFGTVLPEGVDVQVGDLLPLVVAINGSAIPLQLQVFSFDARSRWVVLDCTRHAQLIARFLGFD